MLFSEFVKNRKGIHTKKIAYFLDKVNAIKMCKNIKVPVPKTYFILKNVSEIKNIVLPDNCIIKFNNLTSSRGIVFRINGKFEKFKNIDLVVNFLSKYVGITGGGKKEIEQKIIIEELLKDSSGSMYMNDYKLYCFYGKCYYVLICKNRWNKTGKGKRHYDTNFNRIKLKTHKDSKCNFEKPIHWDKITTNNNDFNSYS